MPCTISLSESEMKQAASVAQELHDSLRKRGVRNGHGLRDADATPEMESGGAQSELAASKFFEVKWSASMPDNGTKGPDIGKRTQVRSSNKYRPSHSLLIRPRDIEKYGDVPYVLVIQNGCEFNIKGWIMAFDGLKIARVYDDNGRPPVYMIHESKLHGPETLGSV